MQRALAAPLLLALMASSAGVANAAAPVQGKEASFALVEATAKQGNIKRDINRLKAAEKVLAQRGYDDEAKRLREIVKVLASEATEGKKREKEKAMRGKAAKRINAAAKKLLQRDIQDRPTRVEMLDLIADGYAAAGYESSEGALRFFVSASRTPEGEANTAPMPDILTKGDGTVMDKLIRIVVGAEEVMRKIDCNTGAAVAERLGQFYVEREAGRGSEPIGLEVEPDLGVNDLVVIERRAPILAWAAEAYAGEDGDSKAHQRMAWISAIGQERVTPGEVEIPEGVNVNGMSQIIDDIDRAGQIYLDRGDLKRAHSCLTLAEYYRLREKGEVADESATPPRPAAVQEVPSGRLRGLGYSGGVEAEADTNQAELRARIEQQLRRVTELTEELTRLEKELSSKRGGGR